MGKLDSAIDINNLSFGFTKSKLLQDVSFSIPTGKFTVIIGQNGAGKSTLLRLMAGLIAPDSGLISIYGQALNQISLVNRAKLIGFLGQMHKAVFPFTVEDVVLTGRASSISIIPREKDHAAALEAIKKVGIQHLQKRVYTELSGGEQQLVMLARILAQQPKILLLDEPFSHLDLNNQFRFIKMIKQFVSEGITIVATMHDPNTAFLYGDNYLFVHNKKVISESWGNHGTIPF